MASFRFGEPSRPTKGKHDSGVVRPLKSGRVLQLQSHGFKGALATLKLGPRKFIEESFKGKEKFIRERVLANAPKRLDSKKLDDNLDIDVVARGSKVSMNISAKGGDLIRAHEDPTQVQSQLSEGHTEEGGKGPKFIRRVFDKHSKDLQKDTLEKFAEGFGDELKKSKGKG